MTSFSYPIPLTPVVPPPPLSTFQVAAVFEQLATGYGVNLFCDGMDVDQCFGAIFATDASLLSLLQQHMVAYNYLIVDGNPAWLIRRATGDDLVIDDTIYQADCVPAQADGPAVSIVRTDIMSLPREVEVSYTDIDRDYNVNTASYRHIGAPLTGGKLSIQVATVINADMARALAADTLWRTWNQAQTITLQHPDLRYGPADILSVVTASGREYVGLVTKNVITPDRLNQLELRAFLTRGGGALVAGGISGGGGAGGVAGDDFGAWLFTGG